MRLAAAPFALLLFATPRSAAGPNGAAGDRDYLRDFFVRNLNALSANVMPQGNPSGRDVRP